MFVDLASFTPLAEAMGDVRAAEILDRFAAMTRRAVQRCHGRIVKQIGDAFMIVFSECYSAVSCGLELEEKASAEPQFPAVRIGLHWGPVLYREGDYIGSNVNIASRLAEEAHRHQFLVTDEVRRRAKTYEGVEFVRLGRRRLKGLAAEVEVFEARAVNPAEIDRVVDPVCGMELSKAEVAATLTWESREHPFCSDDCLRKFVSSPELYVSAAAGSDCPCHAMSDEAICIALRYVAFDEPQDDCGDLRAHEARHRRRDAAAGARMRRSRRAAHGERRAGRRAGSLADAGRDRRAADPGAGRAGEQRRRRPRRGAAPEGLGRRRHRATC